MINSSWAIQFWIWHTNKSKCQLKWEGRLFVVFCGQIENIISLLLHWNNDIAIHNTVSINYNKLHQWDVKHIRTHPLWMNITNKFHGVSTTNRPTNRTKREQMDLIWFERGEFLLVLQFSRWRCWASARATTTNTRWRSHRLSSWVSQCLLWLPAHFFEIKDLANENIIWWTHIHTLMLCSVM